MLSDEERKVMDSLKVISEYAGDNYLAKEHRRKLKLLIELVEKQSKEIEELKEKNKNLNWYFENQKDNFVHKDKIKAKIEEINKEMLNEENSLELFYRKKYCNEVLQSLLEKE